LQQQQPVLLQALLLLQAMVAPALLLLQALQFLPVQWTGRPQLALQLRLRRLLMLMQLLAPHLQYPRQHPPWPAAHAQHVSNVSIALDNPAEALSSSSRATQTFKAQRQPCSCR
jgi:hypothetical protein